MNQPLPTEVLKWLSSLPKKDYLREVDIAERNWARILNHLRLN